jgi:hypothetical protein
MYPWYRNCLLYLFGNLLATEICNLEHNIALDSIPEASKTPSHTKIARLWPTMNNPRCRDATRLKEATPQPCILVDGGDILTLLTKQ